MLPSDFAERKSIQLEVERSAEYMIGAHYKYTSVIRVFLPETEALGWQKGILA